MFNCTARLPYDPITLLPTDVGYSSIAPVHFIAAQLSNICHRFLCVTYLSSQQMLSLVNFPESMKPGKFATFGSGAIKGFAV